MGTAKLADIPYDERSDDQKLESNWVKARALFKREDWSACVLRVATSAEISANIYVRTFLTNEHKLPVAYVDSLLWHANGLDGKFKRLIKPAAELNDTWKTLKAAQKKIEALHEHRNGIAHSGHFKSEQDARECFLLGLAIIKELAPNESAKLKLPFAS
jgi:hypothetical protein